MCVHDFLLNSKRIRSMMVSDSWKNYIIDLRLIKQIGLYQLLNPNTPTKPLGCNIFKLVAVLSLLYLTLTNVMCNISIYYILNDFTEVVKYIMLVFATLFAVMKMYFVIRKSHKLWELIRFTCIHFLPYRGHQKNILIEAREVSIKISKIITLGWITIIIVWILSPIFMQGNYINVMSKDGTSYRRYRYNMLSLIFPVSAQFYNENFKWFYSIEMIATLMYGYSMVIFDCLVISMCITMTYQLKMIALSYSTLGHNDVENNSKSKFYFEIYNMMYIVSEALKPISM